MREPAENRDPTRHLLSRGRHGQRPDGTDASRPIPLAEAAETWRGALEGGRATESRLEFPEDGQTIVAFSAERAIVAADLLEELALRLRPGFAVGPVSGAGPITEVIHDIVAHLRWRT